MSGIKTAVGHKGSRW